MTDLSIIIVNWNVRELVLRCVESVLREVGAGLRVEVIVVDNASRDGSAQALKEAFPGVRLIENTGNAGFTRANNQAIPLATGRYVLLLNPDTEVMQGSLRAMVEYMDSHPRVGALGPKLLNPDLTVQSSRRRFPSLVTAVLESTVLQPYFDNGRAVRRYYVLDRGDHETQEVDWVVGACLLVRRTALDQVGLLDERFFMYSEELDWCYRMKTAGWRVVYLPDARVVHHEGQSSSQDNARKHIHFQSSKVAFFRKHHGAAAAEALRWFLLGTYAYQGLTEGGKLVLRHKPELRRQRLSMIGEVLRSGLGEGARGKGQGSRETPPSEIRTARRGAINRAPTISTSINTAQTIRRSASRGVINHAPTVEHAPTVSTGIDHAPTTKVLLISAEYPPATGGVGDYTFRLGEAMAEAGARVSVLTTRRTGTNEAGPAGALAVMPDWGWQSLVKVAGIIRRERPDVAHIQYQTGAYSMHPAINLMPLLLRPWTSCRWAVTFHDLREPYLFPKAGPLRHLAAGVMALGAHLAITTNAEDQELLRRRFGIHCANIPIGSNISPSVPDGFNRTAWRENLGVADDETLLVHFGLLNRSKGIDLAILALRELVVRRGIPCKLILVGGEVGETDSTNRPYAEEIRRMVAGLGLDGHVIWTGHASPSEVSAHLLNSDIGVFPFRDGASIRRGSLLAALAHGLPVVTTEPAYRGALGIDEKSLSLVPRGDDHALADEVQRLVDSPDARADLARRAREAASRFGWPEIARENSKAYEGIRGGKYRGIVHQGKSGNTQ